jgi:hypothetical protein
MFGHAWIGMPTFLAGSLLPVLRRPVAWTVFAGIAASIAWIQEMLGVNLSTSRTPHEDSGVRPRGIPAGQAARLVKSSCIRRGEAAYDLRKLRGKHLIDKPGRSRHYHLPPPAARTIAGLLTLREQVIAGIRKPRPVANPTPGAQTDRDYEKPPNQHTPSSTTSDSAPVTRPPHRQHFVDPETSIGQRAVTTTATHFDDARNRCRHEDQIQRDLTQAASPST